MEGLHVGDQNVQVKEMDVLNHDSYHFHKVDVPTSLYKSHQNIIRENLNIPDSRCFILHNILTEEECKYYVERLDRIGFSEMSNEYPSEYRSNSRTLVLSTELADCLYARINQHFTRKDLIRIRPICFGNEGNWLPTRLNECFKFCKYESGAHFSPHIDGPWVPRHDESSIYTVVVYLNDDFEGGNTNFLETTDERLLKMSSDPKKMSDKVICQVKPKRGSALIFNHDILHEGEGVYKGSKYIMRSEIMFRRVDTDYVLHKEDYHQDEEYLKALSLYTSSRELHQAKDTKGFTDTYLEALSLQQKAQRSVGKDSNEPFQQMLPYEILLEIFSYLEPDDLILLLTVNKSWHDIIKDGQLWKEFYRKRWKLLPEQIEIIDKSPFAKDWYTAYCQRKFLEKHDPIVVIDLGSHTFKFKGINKEKQMKEGSFKNVIAKVPGIFDYHLRRGKYERYFCGDRAENWYKSKYIIRPVKNGHLDLEHYGMLPELIFAAYDKLLLDSKFAPVIIAEPPGLFNSEEKNHLKNIFFDVFRVPSIAFVSSPILTLYALGKTEGIVVSAGDQHASATVTSVTHSHPPVLFNPKSEKDAGEAIISAIHSSSPDLNKPVDIILTGGRFRESKYLNKVTAIVKEKYPKQNIIVASDPFTIVNGGLKYADKMKQQWTFINRGKDWTDDEWSNHWENDEFDDENMRFYLGVIGFSVDSNYCWRYNINRDYSNLYLKDLIKRHKVEIKENGLSFILKWFKK